MGSRPSGGVSGGGVFGRFTGIGVDAKRRSLVPKGTALAIERSACALPKHRNPYGPMSIFVFRGSLVPVEMRPGSGR
jgi:hypothetical protein